MKFKVGDKVKLINDIEKIKGGLIFVDGMLEIKNKVCKVTQITGEGNYELDKSSYIYSANMLTKVDYTYEDLKKSPIGTKITFENGTVLVKDDKEYFENKKTYRYDSSLENLKDNKGDLGKIIKIEEPKYQTVYESKVEILDEAEKRYLRGVIRPFRDRVKTIKKYLYSSGNATIDIRIENSKNSWLIELPLFEKGEMYKNMEDGKEYTLEELGL